MRSNRPVDPPVPASPTGLEAPQELTPSTVKRFAVNVTSLFSVQVANLLLPLLTVPYLVRVIGPERIGLLSFSNAYIAYFTLLINYGFEMSAVRMIAARRSDQAFVNRIFSEVMMGKTLLWLVSTLIFGVVTWWVPELRAYWGLHCCTYLSCLGFVLFPLWLYQAMEDLGRVAAFNLIVKLLVSASIFLFIRQPADYIYQNLSLSVAQLLISGIALGAAFRRFHLTFTWPGLRQMRIRFFEDSALFFSSLAITLYASSTVFILGLTGSAYSVGIFTAGVRLESIARSFVALALNQAFFPIAAGAFGKSRAAGLAMIQAAFFPLLICLVVAAAALWVVAPYFITRFYGPAFQEAIPVLRVSVLLTITIGISNLLGFHTMLNLRMDRAFFAITGLGSVIGVGLAIILAKRFEQLGATWAWVITEVYIAIAMLVYLEYRGVRIARRSGWQEALGFLKRLWRARFNRRTA